MDWNQLRSMNVSSLFSAFKSDRALLRYPFSKQILLGVLIVAGCIAYIFLLYLPQRDLIEQRRKKVESIPQLELRLRQIDLAVQKSLGELRQAEVNYQALNKLFAVDSELEDLYKRLSQLADSQRLLINALATDGEVAIYEGGRQQSVPTPGQAPSPNPPSSGVPPAGSAKTAPLAVPLFYRIKLKMELTGTYVQYMKYRKLLADFDKSINIDKEQILIIPNDTRGLVRVKAQLSTVRIAQKLQIDSSVDRSLPGSGKVVFDLFEPVFIKVNDSNSNVATPINPQDIRRQTERDPFSRASNGMIEGGRDPRISPLIMADPQSYVITGLILSSSEKVAMIRTDFRENFVVRIGDPLGNQGGKIIEIDQNGVVVSQPSGAVRLYLQTQLSQPGGLDGNRSLSGR